MQYSSKLAPIKIMVQTFGARKPRDRIQVATSVSAHKLQGKIHLTASAQMK